MTDFGYDIKCVSDADDMFTIATGSELMFQCAVHRLTTDSVLGPGGDNWGFDCRKLLGMPELDVALFQPMLAGVLLRDTRFKSADIKIRVTSGADGVATSVIYGTCITSEGPFSFVLPVADVSNATFEAQL